MENLQHMCFEVMDLKKKCIEIYANHHLFTAMRFFNEDFILWPDSIQGDSNKKKKVEAIHVTYTHVMDGNFLIKATANCQI